MPSAGRGPLLEKIPSDETLRSSEIQALVSRDGRKAVTAAVRKILERIRFEISRDRWTLTQPPLRWRESLKRSIVNSAQPLGTRCDQ